MSEFGTSIRSSSSASGVGTDVDVELEERRSPSRSGNLYLYQHGLNGSHCTEDGSAGGNLTGGNFGSLGPEGTPEGAGSTPKICSMASLKGLIRCDVADDPGNSESTRIS